MGRERILHEYDNVEIFSLPASRTISLSRRMGKFPFHGSLIYTDSYMCASERVAHSRARAAVFSALVSLDFARSMNTEFPRQTAEQATHKSAVDKCARGSSDEARAR